MINSKIKIKVGDKVEIIEPRYRQSYRNRICWVREIDTSSIFPYIIECYGFTGGLGVKAKEIRVLDENDWVK
jgi:hypothetical protein